MNCIIVDDEPLAVEIVQDYISKIPNLKLSGIFSSATKALHFIQQNNQHVDLMFLDINMPVLTGIQMIKTLKKCPQFIFTTAYDNFALEGYNLNATDYLLKPITFERFVKAVNRAGLAYQYQLNGRPHSSLNNTSFIFIKSDYKMIRINLDDIIFLESLKEYTRIHTLHKPILTLKSLKDFESILPSGFIRVHKSYIVAINKISYIEKKIILIKDKMIPIGHGYREKLFEMVSLPSK